MRLVNKSRHNVKKTGHWPVFLSDDFEQWLHLTPANRLLTAGLLPCMFIFKIKGE